MLGTAKKANGCMRLPGDYGPLINQSEYAYYRRIIIDVKPSFLIVNWCNFSLIKSDDKCQKLSLGSGLRVSPSHCFSSNQKYGATCSFSCARGYQLSGPSSTQCGRGGIWNEQVSKVSCKGMIGLPNTLLTYSTSTFLDFFKLTLKSA